MVDPTTVSTDTEPTKLPARIAKIEREAIEAALRASGGNRSEAARRLGIARATLYEKLQQHGLSSDRRTYARD